MKKKLILLIALTGSILNASAQLKVGDQPTVLQKSVALDVKGSNGQQGLWLPRVTDTSITGIRALNPPDGLVIYHTPSAKMFLRSNNAWVAFLENAINSVTAGGTTLTGPALTYNVGTAGTNFNITGSGNTATWNLPDASTTARGVVSTGYQLFTGTKTFTSPVLANDGVTVSNGLTVNGSAGSTSNLRLAVTSATAPATATDRYLSVNAAGNVTLNSLNAVGNVTAGGTLLTNPALTYNVGTAGTNFNITGSGSTATWNLPDASATARGAVTNAAQTFGGLKTFGNGVTVNNGSTLNNGTTANNGLNVTGTGATTATSNLTLGVNSATTPAAATDRYLSVNAAGNVTLNTLNAINSVTAGGTALAGPALIYNAGTAGTDFNISSTGSTATWNLPDASTTARGVVTTAAQTFAGAKTLNNGLTVNNGSTLNNGLSVTGTGATTNTSNLTLGVTSATTPAAATDRYLSVNAAGNVTLNSLNAVGSVTAGGTLLTNPALTYNVGTAGTNFNITGSGSTATWNLPDASTTARGAVTNAAQAFGGAKTFSNGVTVNSGSTLNNGTTANNGLNVTGTGATTNTSNLTLGVTSATTPAAPADKFLSVNAAGNVTLNSLNAITSVNAGGTVLTNPAITYNVGTAGTNFNITGSGSTATWNLPDASVTARGVVTTGYQLFTGTKTFTSPVLANDGVTVSNGLTVNGSAGSSSNLKLGVTSATATTTVTSTMLSVDATGQVVVATTNVEANKPSRILNYTLTIFGATVAPNSTYTVNTPLPAAAAVSFPATVYISPSTVLSTGTTVDWATIINNNLVANISTRGNSQNLSNYVFYVTIVDF